MSAKVDASPNTGPDAASSSPLPMFASRRARVSFSASTLRTALSEMRDARFEMVFARALSAGSDFGSDFRKRVALTRNDSPSSSSSSSSPTGSSASGTSPSAYAAADPSAAGCACTASASAPMSSSSVRNDRRERRIICAERGVSGQPEEREEAWLEIARDLKPVPRLVLAGSWDLGMRDPLRDGIATRSSSRPPGESDLTLPQLAIGCRTFIPHLCDTSAVRAGADEGLDLRLRVPRRADPHAAARRRRARSQAGGHPQAAGGAGRRLQHGGAAARRRP